MKTTEIPANLVRINFILAPKRESYCVGSDEAQSFYYPEYGIHNNDCVKWLADIVKCYADRKVVIHTYNDVFINRLGHWVEQGIIPKEDIKIFLIEEDDVTISTFDKTGCLVDWPYGWFMANYDFNYFKKDKE